MNNIYLLEQYQKTVMGGLSDYNLLLSNKSKDIQNKILTLQEFVIKELKKT